VLCEGPLDAARVGPGGVAVIGSSISPTNVELIASKFQIVYTAFDTDKVGKAATEKIGKQLYEAKLRNSLILLVRPLQISQGKDIGAMTQVEFDRMFDIAKKDVSRQY
jgi:DNA primase